MNVELLRKLLAQQEALEEPDPETVAALKEQIATLEAQATEAATDEEEPPKADPKVLALETRAAKSQKELEKLQKQLTESNEVTSEQREKLAKLEARTEELHRQTLIAQYSVPEDLLDVLPEDTSKLEAFLKGPRYEKLAKAVSADIRPPASTEPKGPRTPSAKSSTPKAKRKWSDISSEDLSSFDSLFAGLLEGDD